MLYHGFLQFTLAFGLAAAETPPHDTAQLPLNAQASIPLPDNEGKYHIGGQGIRGSFIPFSAAITNLFVQDRNGTFRDVVLGFDNATAYEAQNVKGFNFGAVVGRYANRIVNHTYELDGVRYYTDRNQAPNSTIHSGYNGWSSRTWMVRDTAWDRITFGLYDGNFSSDGFPGAVLASVTYLLMPYTSVVKIQGMSFDHRTPLMATSHAYWNLDAFANPVDETVLSHNLSLPLSKSQIMYDAAGEPNGTIREIPSGDIIDFWSGSRPIDQHSTDPNWKGLCNPGVAGYDCAYTVSNNDTESLRSVATLRSEWGGIQMEVRSNQAALAMTTCGFFPANTFPIKRTQGGKNSANKGFIPSSGCVAIEPSDWISGISFPEWGREKRQVYGVNDGAYTNEMEFKFGTFD